MRRAWWLSGPVLFLLLPSACGDEDGAKARLSPAHAGAGGTVTGASGTGGKTQRGASGEGGTSVSGGEAGAHDGGAGAGGSAKGGRGGTTGGARGRAGGTTGGGTGQPGGEGGEAGSGARAGSTSAGGEGGGTPSCGRFVALGDLPGGAVGSSAYALSRDGSTVVGQSESANGAEAMRWHESGRGQAMVGLGDLDGGTFEGRAYAVSADGSVVTGVSHSALVDCAGRFDEAFRWTEATGMVGLGDLTGGCFFSYAYGISADGLLVVGGATNDLSNTGATWTEADGWLDLGFASLADNSSSVTAVTPDRSVLVGTERLDATSEYQAFRYTEAGGQELLGDLPGGIIYANASAVSDDGSVLVGFGTTADGEEAFRWTSAGGMVGLGDFADGAAASHANAILPDGSVVVGFGTTTDGQVAALWRDGEPIATVASELGARGVVIPSGFVLREAVGVTADTHAVTIAGNGVNPAGDPEAWLAQYCLP